MSKLDDIKARLAAALAQPDPLDGFNGDWIRIDDEHGFCVAQLPNTKQGRVNSKLFQHCATDLAWAVQRIESLEAALREWLPPWITIDNRKQERAAKLLEENKE